MKKVIINIINKNKRKKEEKNLKKWITKIINPSFINIINLKIVNEKKIYNLNSIYRKKKKSTNILSFSLNTLLKKNKIILGDLIICKKIIYKEAKKIQKKKHIHLAHIIIHGTLHLLGYTHNNIKNKKIMESIETKTMKSLKLPNPYIF